MTFGEITDADKLMNPHFGSDPADIRIRIRNTFWIMLDSLVTVCALRVQSSSTYYLYELLVAIFIKTGRILELLWLYTVLSVPLVR